MCTVLVQTHKWRQPTFASVMAAFIMTVIEYLSRLFTHCMVSGSLLNLFFVQHARDFLCDNLLWLGRLYDFSLIRWFAAFPVYTVLLAHFDESYSEKKGVFL